MDNPQRTLFCLYILFMCLCLPQAIFQTPFSSFLATNGTKCSSTFSFSHCPTFKYFSNSFCNFSHSWESNKFRDTLCLFTPSVTEKFPNISKQTRLKLRESFSPDSLQKSLANPPFCRWCGPSKLSHYYAINASVGDDLCDCY